MKRRATAVARNRDAITEVLFQELPATGKVLEIASGSGEHAMHFAAQFPSLIWQPSDTDEAALASIEAWRIDCKLPNLLNSIRLDVTDKGWEIEAVDAIICINMLHISPWAACDGLFAGAHRLLAKAAPLILYGPYFEDAVETAPSNLAFDASLRARNSVWGVRNLSRVDECAERSGFERTARYVMPANNLALTFRRR